MWFQTDLGRGYQRAHLYHCRSTGHTSRNSCCWDCRVSSRSVALAAASLQQCDDLLKGRRFRPQFFNFGRCRLTGGVTRQPVITRPLIKNNTGSLQSPRVDTRRCFPRRSCACFLGPACEPLPSRIRISYSSSLHSDFDEPEILCCSIP